jgi:hypothetical protein
MTLQQHFEKWLKEKHFPEADIAQKNGQYSNSTTSLIWVGWQGYHGYRAELKRERETTGREFT